MISTACPVIVLDDEKEELWKIAHGLGVCGLPVMSHWVSSGRLERQPDHPHEGVRVLFTDLHILGTALGKPEQYVSALVRLIQQLVSPSTYLIVFWSAYPNEADEAWQLLVARLKSANAENLIPFAYRWLDKADVKNISDEDEKIAEQSTKSVINSINEIFDSFPQLKSILEWESGASRAASATSNELIGKLKIGGIPFTDQEAVKRVLKRMSQEALGLPHAPKAPTKGVYQALMPIAQDWLNKEAEKNALDDFLQLTENKSVAMPAVENAVDGKPNLESLLNDFFIHSERAGITQSARGAVIRLTEDFLNDQDNGLVSEIGLAGESRNWRTAICTEFFLGYTEKTLQDQQAIETVLEPCNIYAAELSADCDYAQDKPRTHRHLLALFVPKNHLKKVFMRDKNKYANDSIYATPDITIGGIPGRLLISCRIFLTRAYQKSFEGAPVTRLRQEVISEVAHHYVTHVRRPGKVAFY